MSFLITWLVTSIATAIAIAVVPGITAVGGTMGPIMCALALALVNAIVKPVIAFLSLPLTVVTLGLFYLVINALMLQLAGNLPVHVFAPGLAIDSFRSAFLGAIACSIASLVVGSVIGQ